MDGKTTERYLGKDPDITATFDSKGIKVRQEESYRTGKHILKTYENGVLKTATESMNNIARTETSYYPNGSVSRIMTYTPSGSHVIEWHSDGSKRAESENHLLIFLRDEKGRDCKLPEGKITVWKASKTPNANMYIELEVPAESKRETYPDFMSGHVAYAKVINITDSKGNDHNELFLHNGIYKVGEMVSWDEFSLNGIEVYKYRDQCDKFFNL